MIKKKKPWEITLPEEVFTPRSPTVNEGMYVPRIHLEERLSRALAGNRYIVIHGESGNGKTWLYKKVLAEKNFEMTSLNLSNAKLYGSISAAIDDKLGVLGFEEINESQVKTGQKIGSSGTGLHREITHANAVQARGSFNKLIKYLRERAGRKKAALVFDNFEQVMENDDLLDQLRAIIVSADDDDIARYDIKVIIVGVPTNLKDLIAKTSGANPIINRLVEIPEVTRIDEDDAVILIKRGLFDKLGLIAEGLTEDRIAYAIAFMADGIAQQIHDCALHVAQEAVSNEGHIDFGVVQSATALGLDRPFLPTGQSSMLQ